MATILSLETSTSVCSAAIHDDGRLVALSEFHENQAHASKLALMVDGLLNLADLTPDMLAAIAISGGPGSYTGLRIGTSMAKGLCFSLGLPLIAISALDLMAYRIARTGLADGKLCPMLDARRMEVYCALYDSQGKRISSIAPLEINESGFSDVLNESRVTFFGPGAGKCRKTITHSNAVFVEGVYPSASELGELGAEKLGRGEVEDLTLFEPLYLKEFIAKKSTKISSVLNK